MIKVCLASPMPPPYGGIAHWTSMITEYASGQVAVCLIVLNTAPTWRSIHVSSVAVRTLGGGIQLIRDVARLCAMFVRDRPDVIHMTTSGHLAAFRDWAFSRLASLWGIPFVYHIRFGRIPQIAPADSWEWKLISSVMRRSATVVAIDRATFLAIQEYAGSKVLPRLIPNCVNLSKLPQAVARSSGRNRTALFLGWVIPTKGVDELVAAWRRLKPTGWRLLIVGPGSDEYLSSFGNCAEDLVEFRGELSHADAMTCMAECDLFVLPSYTEGFPNVVLEAMALGKPIVATRVGAIPEMLDGGVGVLVESKDVESLAKAMNDLIINQELRNELGKRALERVVSRYALDAVFETYVDLWTSHSAQEAGRE